MGLLRYIVQGFGWEVGRTAAQETIDHVRDLPEPADEAPAPSPREQKKLEAAKAKQAAKEAARKKAEIEAELTRLKKQR